MAEMVAGLELLHYRTLNIRQELFYWQREARNSQAEIDYVSAYKSEVLPIEIKAGTQGGMKSLWTFMHEKRLSRAVRCSLENMGSSVYTDAEANNAERNVAIYPLYAVSQMPRLLASL